jgi:hypothetical protein
MGTARATTKLKIGTARVFIARPNGPLEQQLMLRALAVQAAAKQRLRQAPQRIDTGNLLNSIQIRIVRRNGLPVAIIGTNVEYAIYVHEGTIYMEANPFLRDGLIRGMQQFG